MIIFFTIRIIMTQQFLWIWMNDYTFFGFLLHGIETNMMFIMSVNKEACDVIVWQ